MSSRTELADRLVNTLVDALATGDREALAGTLAPDVALRALLPRRSVELTGRDRAAAEMLGWFAEVPAIEPESRDVGEVAGAVRFGFRFALHGLDGGDRVVEQHGFAVVEGDRIAALRLVCSGFRPASPPRAARELDALGEGCATLTPMINKALGGMATGDVLAVLTDDPAAAEGIAAWTRLTGHELVTTRPADDGTRYYLRNTREESTP